MAIVLLVLVGSMGSGAFFILAMVAVVLVAIGFLASRSRTTPSGPQSVVEHDGVQWMKDPQGNFLRWDADAKEWRQSSPPAPEAIRKFDAAAATDTPGWRGGRSVAVVTITVVAIIGLALWAAIDPYAQIPVFSKVVCNLKGASWQEGSPVLGIPPGCYSRPPTEDTLFDESGTLDDEATDPNTQSVLEATLKNAATAQETYATETGGQYTTDVYDLYDAGLLIPDGVRFQIVSVGEGYYCMEASDDLGTAFHYSSDVGTPQEGYCISD